MSEPQWRIQPLATAHKRDGFSCGVPALDDYLRRYARQNASLGVSKTYVLTARDNAEVVGYYTVAAGNIVFDSLPAADRKRLPHYPVPTVHIARLAVSRPHQGRGLGECLLFDCLRRACLVAWELGIYAVTVGATDDRAKNFYQKYGFTPLEDDSMHLFPLLATVAGALFPDGAGPQDVKVPAED